MVKSLKSRVKVLSVMHSGFLFKVGIETWYCVLKSLSKGIEINSRVVCLECLEAKKSHCAHLSSILESL